MCILGFSCAIFLRWIRDQTMKAFIGRLMCSFFSLLGEPLEGEVEELEAPELWGDIWVMADMAPREEDMPERLGEERPMLCMFCMLCMADTDMLGTPENMLLCWLPNTVITGDQETLGTLVSVS